MSTIFQSCAVVFAVIYIVSMICITLPNMPRYEKVSSIGTVVFVPAFVLFFACVFAYKIVA